MNRRTFCKDLAKLGSGLFVPAAFAILHKLGTQEAEAQSLTLNDPVQGVAGSGTGVDPVATDWANRVVSNGGTLPSIAYQTAVSNFAAGMKTDGNWNSMIVIGSYVPGPTISINPPAASCYAPVTPILVGPGTSEWLLTNGSHAASVWPSDGQTHITVNGLQAAQFSLGAVPSTIWSSASNIGVSVYLYSLSGNYAWGTDNYNTGHRMRLAPQSGTNAFYDFGNSDFFNAFNLPAGGMISINKTATGAISVYFANGSNSPSIINTNVDTADARDASLNWWIGNVNNPAGGAGQYGGIISGHLLHGYLTLAQFTQVFNRYQTFRQAIGGGYV